MSMSHEPEVRASQPPSPSMEPDEAARRTGSEDYFRDQVQVVIAESLAAEEAHLPPPQDLGEDG